MFAYSRHPLEIKDMIKIGHSRINMGLTVPIDLFRKNRKTIGGQKPVILTS